MMFTLQEKVHSVKTQFLENTPFFTKEEFIELFAILRPQYDLDDESAGKIFDTTDKSKEGKIPKDEVERILDAVIESEDQNDMSNSSIVLDAKVSVLLKSGKTSIAAPKISQTRGSTQVRNVPDEFFTELDLNKITEIKHIFSICEKNKGYVTIDQIKDFINDVKQFSCSPQELVEIFNYMKDEKTNTITSEMFYNKITEAEKAILGAYMGEQDFEERSRMGTQSFMIDDAASEYYAAEYNPSMFEQEDFVDKLEHTYNQNLDKDFNWIVQKIKSVIDEARRSSRQVDIVSILNEIVNICPQLENKLKTNDAVYKEANEKWTEQNKMEEFLRMRIANLELESKQQKEFLLNLQNENENLCVTIGELESKINLDHQTQKDLIEKNNEIVRLERSVRERESEKDELRDYIKSVESENQTLTQNYKEIQALLKNMDKDMETDENLMNVSNKSKNLLELESLQLELRTALNKIEDIEKEKINMKDINNELKEQLTNSKEFIDALRLEKNDLQTRLDKLQKELEALRSENFGKASAFLQSSKRVSSMKDSLVRAMGFSSTPLLRVSHRENPSPGLKQINEEEEEIAGIQMANSEIMSKKSVVSTSNEPEINHFMTAPSILKSKRKEENNIEVMEEAKCMTIPTEQKVAAQTMDLMNDIQFSENPVVVMKQSEVKEEENNNVDNLLLESMNIPQVRLSTVPKPKPVVEVSAKMEEQKRESLIHPLSSVKPVSTLKETSDKKVHLDSVSLVESQVAIEPQPVVAPVHMNQPQNANDRASLQALPFDLRNLDQDYLDLLNKLPIQELLRSNGELINYGVCFSDNVYRITSKEQRNYRILLITNQALYCLHPGNYQIKRKIPLEKISKITMSETSAGLFAIHVPKEYDYVMDTFKRLNLILFLQTLFKAKNLKLFPIIYKQNLSVRNRGQTLTKQISQYDKSVINPNLQTTYKSTKKFGDLYLETKMIFTIWKKYFFVVTNLGLLYYKKEGSQKPVDFIPFVGYQIIDNNEIKDNKFIFRIKFPHSNYVATLGASSDMEKREWLKAIIEAKEAQEKKENQESSVMNKKIDMIIVIILQDE